MAELSDSAQRPLISHFLIKSSSTANEHLSVLSSFYFNPIYCSQSGSGNHRFFTGLIISLVPCPGDTRYWISFRSPENSFNGMCIFDNFEIMS
ncbi:hypothetical protein ALC60_11944 [Trachymyrmex zeteki]|uniref:Uncharacterized protein n=1 Tax=Mycetomoellerius zeteki TaxID=64791 RepID=A0A151WM39_9HYME|nr:hypothetical protein ALC60_11944 [Trachymyrmex zeteki]